MRDDDAVKAFVAKVGKVDVLVNSAYEGLAAQKAQLGKKFYERPLGEYDDHMSGVRWAYALSQLVAPGMVEAKAGLIVNISSAGGIFYFCGVPYGVMHAALDKLGADVATELKGTGVTCVTVWPGAPSRSGRPSPAARRRRSRAAPSPRSRRRAPRTSPRRAGRSS